LILPHPIHILLFFFFYIYNAKGGVQQEPTVPFKGGVQEEPTVPFPWFLFLGSFSLVPFKGRVQGKPQVSLKIELFLYFILIFNYTYLYLK